VKKIISLVLSIFFLLSPLTSCGYNSIMYEHLTDASNYQEYSAQIVDITYYDKDHTPREDYGSADIATAEYVIIEVLLESKEEIAPFYGVSVDNLPKDCSEYPVSLKIDSDSNKALYTNGFYNVVKEDTEITLKASNWIYMDGYFFYVSSVMYDGVEYLSESDGLSNIEKMIKKNRSLI